jgi:hypothetical protein
MRHALPSTNFKYAFDFEGMLGRISIQLRRLMILRNMMCLLIPVILYLVVQEEIPEVDDETY